MFGSAVGAGTLALLIAALFLALSFEFVNGLHDTANAVTTVIYTHTLDWGAGGFCKVVGRGEQSWS